MDPKSSPNPSQGPASRHPAPHHPGDRTRRAAVARGAWKSQPSPVQDPQSPESGSGPAAPPPDPGDPGPAGGRDARLPARTRRILHLDVDAFLASVEEALHPELRGRPVVVGGPPTSRNLVMSSSYPARRRGVFPGLPLAEAARRCPDAVFRDGDSQAANRLREELTKLCLDFTPRVEVASIDDLFLDLTGTRRLLGSAFEAAEAVRTAAWEELHLPLTLGVGTSRMLARLAGKLAKPGGVAEILPQGELAFLGELPVEALPGVGHRLSRHLERFAVRTVGELRLFSREVLFSAFGRDGLVIHDRARGLDSEPVESTHRRDADGELVARPPRSIQRVSTFEPEEGRRELVEAMLSYVVERAAHHLRHHRLLASSVAVRIAYVDTRPPGERSLRTPTDLSDAKRRALPRPSDATDAIWQHARTLFRSLSRRRALVKRIGFSLFQLTPRSAGLGWQGDLFSDPEADRESAGTGPQGSRADRQRRLDQTLDELRNRLGFGRVLRGSSVSLGETHPLGPDGYRLRTPSLNQ